MLKRLKVDGFRTLVNTEVPFDPLTIMIGKNGVGKTTILDSLQLLGNFARGGVNRAFGPPPWSLSWQRTKGIGRISAVRFEVQVAERATGAALQTATNGSYLYGLCLSEKDREPLVTEERVMHLADNRTVASLDVRAQPLSGTVLSPGKDGGDPEIEHVSQALKSVISYELNPRYIEQPNDPEHNYISREGFGVAGVLANMKESDPEWFSRLEARFQEFRPETESIAVWAASGKVFWGLRDQGQDYPFPAVHLSWGDRQLVGLLCVLYTAKPGATIAIEEIDRGFNHARYAEVIEVLTKAAYDGIDGRGRIQIVVTTHSPSFLNKLDDRLGEVLVVTRVPGGSTVVRPLSDLAKEKLGTDSPDSLPGELWESDLLSENRTDDAETGHGSMAFLGP